MCKKREVRRFLEIQGMTLGMIYGGEPKKGPVSSTLAKKKLAISAQSANKTTSPPAGQFKVS